MASRKKDIHKAPFDEGTKEKLAIFHDYLQAWLGVFFSQRYWKTLNIFDFFAGPGSDVTGYPGTPLIILSALAPYFDAIVKEGFQVNLYLNEYDNEKLEELKATVSRETNGVPFSIQIDGRDFKEAFALNLPKMAERGCANLLFLDQTGIKQIDPEIFRKIIELKRTDFLFFISSSTFKRFSDHPYIMPYLDVDPGEIDNVPYNHIHRFVRDYYRGLLPLGYDYYLSAFSLKKSSGVYGIIFGSGHPLGMEKFLATCWKLDPNRGEANFDIDADNIVEDQYDIFLGDVPKPKKVYAFENELRKKILNGELTNDREIYRFMILNGFLARHVTSVIKMLHEEGKIAEVKLTLTSKVTKSEFPVKTIQLI